MRSITLDIEKQALTLNMMPLVEELLKHGQTVKMTATGISMLPFIRPSIDQVLIVNTAFEVLKKWDVVLTRTQENRYVLHRVCAIHKDSYYINGDAQYIVEGPYQSDQLIGRVEGFWRKTKYIECNSKVYLMLVWLWFKMRRFRRHLLRIYKY